jgi:hypothetical protein
MGVRCPDPHLCPRTIEKCDRIAFITAAPWLTPAFLTHRLSRGQNLSARGTKARLSAEENPSTFPHGGDFGRAGPGVRSGARSRRAFPPNLEIQHVTPARLERFSAYRGRWRPPVRGKARVKEPLGRRHARQSRTGDNKLNHALSSRQSRHAEAAVLTAAGCKRRNRHVCTAQLLRRFGHQQGPCRISQIQAGRGRHLTAVKAFG